MWFHLFNNLEMTKLGVRRSVAPGCLSERDALLSQQGGTYPKLHA